MILVSELKIVDFVFSFIFIFHFFIKNLELISHMTVTSSHDTWKVIEDFRIDDVI